MNENQFAENTKKGCPAQNARLEMPERTERMPGSRIDVRC